MGALRFAASGTSAALGASTLSPSASASARVAIAQRESAAPQLLQVSLLLFPHLPSPPSHLHPLFVLFHGFQSLPVNTYSYLDDGKTYICPFACDSTAFILQTTRDSLCQPRRAPAPPNLPASSARCNEFCDRVILTTVRQPRIDCAFIPEFPVSDLFKATTDDFFGAHLRPLTPHPWTPSHVPSAVAHSSPRLGASLGSTYDAF